jgi:hypothetical protein
VSDHGRPPAAAAWALSAPMPPGNSTGSATVREHLASVLLHLLTSAEGWALRWEIRTALTAAGLVVGDIGPDGRLGRRDPQEADALMRDAVSSLGLAPTAPAGELAEPAKPPGRHEGRPGERKEQTT